MHIRLSFHKLFTDEVQGRKVHRWWFLPTLSMTDLTCRSSLNARFGRLRQPTVAIRLMPLNAGGRPSRGFDFKQLSEMPQASFIASAQAGCVFT